MKSFSSTSFASDQAELLDLALAAVRKNPQALFTNFQWFLYQGRDTVFFTAFSRQSFDPEKLANLVAGMVALAPQLTHGFFGARPGQPFPKHILDAVTSVEYVDEFDGYPDKWLSKSEDIFARNDLPLFRVMAAVRKGGPDAEGRASILQVRSSHALLEGSDSALLTRSQTAAHGVMSDESRKVPLWTRFKSAARGIGLTLMYLLIANIMAVKEQPWGFKTLAIERHRLRLLANRLGVRQRSLYFALVTHALNGNGPDKHMSKRVIGAAYTMLDGNRTASDDDFFRVRALEAKFKVDDNFVEYVRHVDDAIDKIESKDLSRFQVTVNAMFRTLRALNSVFPFLPNRRFWRFNNFIHIVLTLVPPHRTQGPMTTGMIEPIYCGAWHTAVNICTFCPSRDYVTFNFSMEQRHIVNVDKVEELLTQIEASDFAPRSKVIVEAE